jgi:hypothetical protein
MNERIRELAEQAGAKYYVHADYLLTTDLDVEQFAALIRQDENEACAVECDKWAAVKPVSDFMHGSASGARQCAAAIRERMK